MSPTANSVRHDVYGMDASEAEFLAVYNLRRAYDEAWGGVNLAIWYGFGLIGGALVLALIYAWLCREPATKDKPTSPTH
jgi:hypothetical protein